MAGRKSFLQAGHTPTLVAALLDRLHKSKARSSDAWLEGIEPRTPTQFIPIQALETVTP